MLCDFQRHNGYTRPKHGFISPPEKAKMMSMGLQVMCLLRPAKQIAGLGADLTWISAGNVIRTAMYLGLHRDPKHLSIPSRPLYSSELRRRPTRLAIAKSVNDFQPVTAYNATLVLDEELRPSGRDLGKQVMAWPGDDLGVSGVSDFQRRITEWALYRFFFALHVP
jgi:hypothetical protein